MRKFVVIVEKSAGNESVGQMWKETYIFDENATLKEIALKVDKFAFDSMHGFGNNTILTLAEIMKEEK